MKRLDRNAVITMLERQIVELRKAAETISTCLAHNPARLRSAFEISHRLKGGAACLGFSSLGNLAGEINRDLSPIYKQDTNPSPDTLQKAQELTRIANGISVEHSALMLKLNG